MINICAQILLVPWAEDLHVPQYCHLFLFLSICMDRLCSGSGGLIKLWVFLFYLYPCHALHEAIQRARCLCIRFFLLPELSFFMPISVYVDESRGLNSEFSIRAYSDAMHRTRQADEETVKVNMKLCAMHCSLIVMQWELYLQRDYLSLQGGHWFSHDTVIPGYTAHDMGILHMTWVYTAQDMGILHMTSVIAYSAHDMGWYTVVL